MNRIVASNSTEMVHGVSMSSRAILSMSSSRKAIPVQLFWLFLEDDVDAPRLTNPLQMSGVRWFRFLLFHLFPSVCAFWSAIMISSNLYFQSKRSPIVRNCCAHSTTAVFSVRGRIESRYVLSCNHMYF